VKTNQSVKQVFKTSHSVFNELRKETAITPLQGYGVETEFIIIIFWPTSTKPVGTKTLRK